MLANYGYKDGSGDYFITIDTDKCNGCEKCVEACPQTVYEMGEDDSDPLREDPVARVTGEQRKKLKYTCAPCKPYLNSLSGEKTEETMKEIEKLPCVSACELKAITHSW
ncbi:MAG: 4Fe-4S dicluster domain-containing protein [Desulfobacterium sp.]|nr:4Fe-4S dicluster domain-containing protein [Desulfobacterium sp.]MBU3946859.1 ferredoxin family protein [Pseudomonadota bacterium]MBU4009950.1 ferredoxin family protein [Pseudomonadota bacterium]MBU4037927.1 ferredoxin family protein [Pseudomonadota bacterium]